MKKLTFKIIFLLVLCSTGFTQWQYVTVDNSGSRFADVSVVNQDIIWTIKMDLTNNIFKSTNGGISWTAAGSINNRLYFISAVNENTAWLSTLSGEIYRTTNGGMNWVEQNYQPKYFINFLKFFNENTGIFMADAPSAVDTLGFFITRNGGLNWFRSQNAPIIQYDGALQENCINALDSNLVWFCANVGSNVFKLYKLTGGLEAVWQVYDYGFTGDFRNAVFKNTNTGLAIDPTKVILTTDGGINWRLINSTSSGAWIADFILVPGSDWVIMNSTSIILKSRDFCETWDGVSGFNLYDLTYSDSKDTNSIWISYNHGLLLKYKFGAIGIENISNEIPTKFLLYQNYPNPFNPVTKIRFALTINTDFSISIYNVLGKEVYSVKDAKPAGLYELEFNAEDLPSGIYFYRFQSAENIDTKKMILIK